MIAPTGVCRRTAAASVRAIDDVVVNQRGAMQEFDHGCELDGAAAVRIPAGSVTMAQEQQSRPEALPSPAQQVAGDFGNRLIGCRTLARKFLFDKDQVFPHQLKNLLDRQ